MKKIIIMLIPILIFSSCTYGPAPQNRAELYYSEKGNEANLVKTKLETEGSDEELVREIFVHLKNPDSKKAVSPIPDGTELLDVAVYGSVCVITLPKTYFEKRGTVRAVSDASLTKSICSLPNIDMLTISDGESMVSYTSDSFITEIPNTKYKSYTINLYFKDNENTALRREVRTISLSEDEMLEKAVLNALIGGPLDDIAEVSSAIPKGTRINGVSIDEGICVVDFSEEFTKNLSHSYAEETLALYSVANTLTELPMIDSVKFLTDGKVPAGFLHYAMALPITNNQKLIMKTGE